ncbi:MAG: DegV family protein [Candidatus Heimdallarchaeota archaeon]|nr:DegV family protein [Candidatus Heimdallarchaeota archaeon]MDH5645490.1 DegV family protein [Candidatus Heimdallarchaeota archaeon]
MDKVAIVTDSTSDIQQDRANELNVYIVEPYFFFDGIAYTSKSMSIQEFDQKIDNVTKENFPTTSQPSPQDFIDAYHQVKKDGYTRILSIHLSSKISGTINSARIASEEFDDMEIIVVDTMGVSVIVTACIEKARILLSKNVKLIEIAKILTDYGNLCKPYLALDTLENLVRSGRISPLRYKFGKLLKIKPILTMQEGKLTSIDKVKGLSKSRDRIYSLALKSLSSKDTFRYFIGHSNALDVAMMYDSKLKEEFPLAVGIIIELGMALRIHSGKKALFIMAYNIE